MWRAVVIPGASAARYEREELKLVLVDAGNGRLPRRISLPRCLLARATERGLVVFLDGPDPTRAVRSARFQGLDPILRYLGTSESGWLCYSV